MGLLDGVKAVIGDLAVAMETSIARIGGQKIPMAFAKFYPGGLPAFLDRLKETGHGGEVESWLAGTDLRPIPASAVTAALPAPVAEAIATDLSVSRERLPTALAEFLPEAVAGQCEDGRLKPQPTFSSTQIAS